MCCYNSLFRWKSGGKIPVWIPLFTYIEKYHLKNYTLIDWEIRIISEKHIHENSALCPGIQMGERRLGKAGSMFRQNQAGDLWWLLCSHCLQASCGTHCQLFYLGHSFRLSTARSAASWGEQPSPSPGITLFLWALSSAKPVALCKSLLPPQGQPAFSDWWLLRMRTIQRTKLLAEIQNSLGAMPVPEFSRNPQRPLFLLLHSWIASSGQFWLLAPSQVGLCMVTSLKGYCKQSALEFASHEPRPWQSRCAVNWRRQF